MRQAEHQLIAPTAEIGAARAALFPHPAEGGDRDDLVRALGPALDGRRLTVTGSPSARPPLVDGGRERAPRRSQGSTSGRDGGR
ncbi:hypothetical protein [Sphingomonas sp. BK580]|uniref:hypothetical protein n=1 Tax=Sphingomonas sp. BK580 TaxID=2586972 RepID=UPI00160A086B|nr:hypothetical protein [Sphingomonas sp. BK580]MBB3691734.1 outer membrane protein TolC [Sphingomonas sp. BK580]